VVEAGFLRAAHRSMLMVERDPATLVARMMAYEPPVVEKWIGREQR
jgi:hypothetical protein